MIGIIQDWLFSQLGIYYNFDKLEESNIFQDGSVFADILTNYGVLNSDFTINITKGWEHEICQKNLKLMKPIFDMLSVNFDDNVILDIIRNKKVTIVKLLYELYVCLENKQHLYFITQEKFERIQKSYINGLNKDGISVSNAQAQILTKDEDKCLKKPLVDNKDIVEWYKNKFKLIENNLSSRLHKLKETTREEQSQICYTNEKPKRFCPCSCTTGSGDQELIAHLPDLDMFNKSNSNERLLDYKQFIASFKAKQHRSSAKQCFEKNIQNELLQQTWDKVMEKQNEMYNSVFSQIMLKQSQYEKQILTKLIQTQKQIKIENKNLIHATSKVLEAEEKHINGDFTLKEEFEQLKQMYENEQKRVLELHKKLYKRKQDLTKKKHYELCLDVLDSFIDLALSASEYQSKYGVPVPTVLWNSWKQYFYKSQPVQIPFQTLETSMSSGVNVNYDDVIDFEKQTSAIVNENDIEEYLYTCGRWFYAHICKDYGDINENALAFIVYRLLSLKYPPPPSPLPANLPLFRIAGVLLDFYNVDCIEKLNILLSKPRVHAFDPDTAIKSSISKFEEETLGNNVEKTPKKSKQTKSSKDKNRKKSSVTSNKNKKGDKPGKKKKITTENVEHKDEGLWVESTDGRIINLFNKETQTSIIGERTIQTETERSALGLIGEQVFNTLKEGKKVEDELLVNVIIEYLKTLNDYDGWVLLNYPTTINQASILELALSGKKLPIEGYILGDEELAVEEHLTDENELKRKSKILPCPVDETKVSPFKSHFTVFIKTTPNPIEQPKTTTSNDHKEDYLSRNEGITESNCSVKDSDIILPDVLEALYTDLSIYQNFYCESYDLMGLKKLARAILQDGGIEETLSVDLFGKETLDKLSKGSKKEKKDKGVALDKKKKSAKTKNTRTTLGGGDEDITTEKNILNTEDSNNIEIKELSSDTEQINQINEEGLQSKSVTPGDEGWQFVALPLIGEMAIVLATFWENLETCYLQNLEDICFENRLINLRLVPYSTYVKETVNSVAIKPDMRQDLVNQFQEYYMGLDKNLRVLPEVKNYLFCKTLEMQQNLWQIIDSKKNEVESKRKELIHENWLVNELCILINNYLSLVQTEFDRSISTFKLISDYYLTMLEKNPTPSMNLQLMQSTVSKITTENLLFGPFEELENTKNPEFISSPSISSSNHSVKTNYIAQNLIQCNEKEKVTSIVNTFLPREVERMSTLFQRITHDFEMQIKAEEAFLAAASKKLAKGTNVTMTGKGNKSAIKGSEKPKGKKNSKVKKLSDTNSDKEKGKDVITNKTIDDNNIEIDRIKKELLLTEWKFVVDTEFERFKFRMNLISCRAKEDIMEFYCYLESVFCELHSSNLSKYDTDISNTNKLCDYFRTAIEEEALLTYSLVLKRSDFFVDVTPNLTNEHEYDEIKELFERSQDCYFTINQLKKLMSIFKIAGPHGIIRKQPFCYILQDLMLFNDDDNQPHLPRIWNLLNEHQLLFVLESMFGSEYGINWRDFLIYNLEISYPSCDEILSLRKQFMSHDLENAEVVSMEVYDSIKLWFEQDLPNNPQEGLRFRLIKELLWEMFQVNDNLINYTALLLYFCKDYDPTVGLKKALSLAIGKNVIISEKELATILKEEAEIKASVTNLLENIINSIVYAKEGTLIYEIFGSMTDFNVDYSDTNYSVISENSESEYGSLDSVKAVIGIDDVENSFHEEKESLTTVVSVPDNDLTNRNKTWVSNIPIDAVSSILNASFLHQDNTFSLRNQYLNCLEEVADEKGLIEAHVLVISDCMSKLFKLTNKFKISSPCEILGKCLIDP